GLSAQYALVLPPRRHRDAVVPRPGTGAPRSPLRRAGVERRAHPARRPVTQVVDRPRPDGGLVRRVFREGRGRAPPLGRGIPADRRTHPPPRSAIAAAAAGPSPRIAGTVAARPPASRSLSPVAARIRPA